MISCQFILKSYPTILSSLGASILLIWNQRHSRTEDEREQFQDNVPRQYFPQLLWGYCLDNSSSLIIISFILLLDKMHSQLGNVSRLFQEVYFFFNVTSKNLQLKKQQPFMLSNRKKIQQPPISMVSCNFEYILHITFHITEQQHNKQPP